MKRCYVFAAATVRRSRLPLLGLLLSLLFLNGPQALVSVIPKPNQMIVDESAPRFTITSSTTILVEQNRSDLQQVGQYLRDLLAIQVPGLPPVASHGSGAQPAGSILLTTVGADPNLGIEGYQLDADASRVTIRAVDRRGVFYGVQTLRQLLPPAIESPQPTNGDWSIPQASIDDKPAVAYRAFMLDVSRTFFPKEFLFRHIDLMALHKNNVFHLHLADDQGWRIESFAHPSLHELGAFWDKTAVPQFGDGYYTQQEVAEIVQYAALRNVQIIPEIDLPAHSLAMLHALPELACNQPRDASEFLVLPWAQWGVSSHEPICPAPESNYDTLDAIVGEVAALVPSPYFHVGTDEVQVFDSWNTSAEVAALKAQEGLSNNSQLQAYFAKRMEGIVNARGKTLVAWGEARFHSNALPPALSDLSLDDDSVTMYWADPGDNEQMFQFPYVLTPWTHLYYDIVGNGQTAIQYGFDPISYVEARPRAAGNGTRACEPLGHPGLDVDPRRSLPARAGRRPVRLPFSLRDVRSRVDEAANRNHGDFLTRLQVHAQRLAVLSARYYDPSANADGLVGHWPCDEGAGDLLHDSTGQLPPGQLLGGAAWAPGRTGSAVSLNGANDYAEMGYSQNWRTGRSRCG